MAHDTQNIEAKTIGLIDSLRTTCGEYGLAGGGSEYKIITEMFLYKFFNDKFGYEVKNHPFYGERLSRAEKWDSEYDKFTEEEIEDLFSYLPGSVPRLKPHQTLAHLYNASTKGDFSTLLDATLIEIASLNEDTFSVLTSGNSKVQVFKGVGHFIIDPGKRDQFALALMKNLASFNFEEVFSEKYDFFSRIFQYLIKDYNNAGGGKYAEYYTPREIATVMARLLVGDEKKRGVTCYDPAAGTGTLLLALAHQIGEDRCSICSQDISEKSSEMLRLNLILNGLSESLPNVRQGNTLLEPAHKESNGTLRKFDFVVSNPPFKLDFPEYRDTLAADGVRFWAGVPNAVQKIKPKPTMAIYTCFIQHVLNSLSKNGKAAVVPTGFITSKSGIRLKILKRIVDEKWVYGVISMPSNVFADTGTNVSVLFFDKSSTADKVILVDASRLGEDYQDANGNKKHRLLSEEIELLVNTFREKKVVEDLSVVATYEEIQEKGYSLSAGQYFDIKIEYSDITEEEFNKRMSEFESTLSKLFVESQKLDSEILKQLKSLKYNV